MYAPTDFHEKKVLWEKIKNISSRVMGPWVVAGDFNDFCVVSDKEGGNNSVDFRRMGEFNSMVSTCRLIEVVSKGNPFTWCNKRGEEEMVKEKIDHVFANLEWIDKFPMGLVLQLPWIGSDHSP